MWVNAINSIVRHYMWSKTRSARVLVLHMQDFLQSMKAILIFLTLRRTTPLPPLRTLLTKWEGYGFIISHEWLYKICRSDILSYITLKAQITIWSNEQATPEARDTGSYHSRHSYELHLQLLCLSECALWCRVKSTQLMTKYNRCDTLFLITISLFYLILHKGNANPIDKRIESI